MKTCKNIIGFLWCLPWSIFMWVLVAFLKMTMQIESIKIKSDLTLVVDLKNGGWFNRIFFKKRGWGGFGFGNVAMVVDSDTDRWKRTVKHENTHSHQFYRWGIFYPLIYLAIYFYLMTDMSKHPYYDHPFELEARRAAGQRVDIPREHWKKDRWVFW